MRGAWLTLFLFPALAAQPLSVTLPEYAREVLPNGAVLCLMPKPGAPLFSLRVLVRGGAESDPPARAGLSSVVTDLLMRGTTTRSADEFAAEIDFLGASLHTSVNYERSALSLDVLPSNAGAAIDLVAGALLRPAFRDSEARNQVQRSIELSRSLKDSPEDAAWQYFRSFYFPAKHPYSRSPRGDEVTLARITRSSILKHHHRYFTGRNLIVAAVGPFSGAELRSMVEKAFAPLPPGWAYRWREPRKPRTNAQRLLLIDEPGATQTQFILGLPGISRTDPDRIALWLADNILGGRFTSLLNERLRVESGLTYGAYSYLQQDRMRGVIALHSSAATAETKRALDLTLDTLRRFAHEGIAPDQLAAARAYIEAGYPPDHLQTADQLADLLGDLEVYGLDRHEVDTLFARLNAVTVEEANRVLRKYYGEPYRVLIVLGRAEALRSGLRRYAPTLTESSITEPGYRWQRQGRAIQSSKR